MSNAFEYESEFEFVGSVEKVTSAGKKKGGLIIQVAVFGEDQVTELFAAKGRVCRIVAQVSRKSAADEADDGSPGLDFEEIDPPEEG